MQALNASLSGAETALPVSNMHGLGLLGSRALEGMDLHRSGVRATLVTATEDGVLNFPKLYATLDLLPKVGASDFADGNPQMFFSAFPLRSLQISAIHSA